MFKFIAICVMVMGLTLQACDKGCLKCNAKSECLFCDTTNKYYLSGTSCASSTLTNCATLAQNGECTVCANNFYVDAATKKCVAVETAKLVANCVLYSAAQACLKCAKNFLVKDGKCTAVVKLVDNCDYYVVDGVCAGCATGFIFNATRDACVAVPSAANCSAYSFLDCKTCAAGYIANQNLYFADFTSSATNIWTAIQTVAAGSASDWTSLRRCQLIADTNCLVATAANVCATCKPGYFLTAQKTCRAFPFAIIEGCLAYSSLTTCRQCQIGFYLESNVKCTLIAADKLITDCQTYDNAAASVVCTLCATTKYLSANTCTNARSASLAIAQCKTTTVDADTCATCNDNYTLTTDKKACLASIANCLTYSSSTASTTTLTCQTCANTYYLNTANSVTTCVAGTLEGCVTYTSSTVCAVCNTAGYYLNGSTCTKHVTVENCSAYSASNVNECATCTTGFYPFKLSVTCASITVIAHCTAYTDATTCSTCGDGYFLKNNLCVSYSTLPNCKTANASGACTACLDGYMLLAGATPTCVAIHNYIADNCQTFASSAAYKDWSTADLATCAACKENSESYDLSYTYACFATSQLVNKGVTAALAVDGCKRYGNNPTGNVPRCVQCVSPKKLQLTSTTYTCVASCTATSTHYADMLDGRQDVCIERTATADGGIANCAEAIYIDIAGTATPTCIGYETAGHINAITTAVVVDALPFARDVYPTTALQPTAAFLYRGFPILSDTTGNVDDAANTSTRCELYAKKSSKFYCYRCNWGYATTTTVDSSELKSVCTAITNCDLTASYGGFPGTLNQLLSCHKCSAGKALLLTVTGTADQTLTLTEPIVATPTLQCVDTNSATLPSAAVVANCAVHLNIGPNVVGATKTCAACIPGYKLTLANSDKTSTTCAAITDCDLTRANVHSGRCDFCSQTNNGTPINRAAKTIDFVECVAVNTANCLFSDGTAVGGVYGCGLCKAGFVKNADGVCAKVTFPKCNDAAVNNVQFTTQGNPSDAERGAYYLIRRIAGTAALPYVGVQGCDTCSLGYTAIEMPTTERQCVTSDYVTQNVYVTSTKYVADCARYYNNKNAANSGPQFTCAACKNNKIPTVSNAGHNDGNACVDAISNCLVARASPNQAQCDTCADTHVNVAGACVIKAIANCLNGGYADTSSSGSAPQCSNCDVGYYLKADKTCALGSVAFCDNYTDEQPLTCIGCIANYNLISTANTGTYCLKTNANSNCADLDVTVAGLQNNLYKCSTCAVSDAAAFFVKTYSTLPNQSTLPQSVCLALNPVDKCTTYSVASTTVASNSYLCTACADGFYLNTDLNTCVARTNQPAGCTTYYVSADKCQVCNDSTFKNVAETDCASFPSGILGCSTYTNDTVCTGCNAPRFLNNNTCTASTPIAKCVTYTANYTCTACESNYFLTNATYCEAAKATGCFTYTSISACEKCDPTNANKGLKTDTNGVTSCVDKNVANCDLSTDTFPFKCTQCKRGFYLGADGACAAATNIAKCSLYDSSATCTLCDAGSVLTTDRKTCNDTYFNTYNDAFCADSQQLSTASCARCSPGYVFANSTCTACSNNTAASGCFSCDPTNQTACFACRPGYYQGANGACQANAVTAPDTNNTNNATTSATITKIFAFLGLLLALLA